MCRRLIDLRTDHFQATATRQRYNILQKYGHEQRNSGGWPFDTTVKAMALPAKEMNTKYQETSARGLAICVMQC
jgi:hypothetical protein